MRHFVGYHFPVFSEIELLKKTEANLQSSDSFPTPHVKY